MSGPDGSSQLTALQSEERQGSVLSGGGGRTKTAELAGASACKTTLKHREAKKIRRN